jgi:5'(3')-deoxyribonucleotidase
VILNSKPTIFLDSDGVCADFDALYEAEFGHAPNAVHDDQMWANINAHGNFFSSLPLIDGTLDFIKKFQKTHNIVILTACPKSDYQRAATQKKAWFKTIVDPDLIVLPVLGGKNKYLFMQKPGDVLIDDFAKNIAPWNEAGGFGIVHTDWATTTEALAKYLAV